MPLEFNRPSGKSRKPPPMLLLSDNHDVKMYTFYEREFILKYLNAASFYDLHHKLQLS